MRILIITGLLCISVFGIAHADQSNAGNGGGAPPAFVSLAQYNNSNLRGLYSNTAPGDLSSVFNKVFTILLSIGAMAAVLRLVYAGYLYMMSDLWTSKQRAAGIIRDVTIGVLLLLSIYLILYQINPDLLKLNILRDVTTSSAPATAPSTVPVSTPTTPSTSCSSGQYWNGQVCAPIPSCGFGAVWDGTACTTGRY